MGNCSTSCLKKKRKGTTTEDPPPQLSTPRGAHLIENLKLGRQLSKISLHDVYAIDLEKPLGRGIGGFVYMAIHKESGKKYAIKSLETGGISMKKMDDLRSEIRLMSELDHPHIIRLVDTIEEPGCMHLIQELSTGGELLKRVNASGFTEDEARRHILTMIDVLRYLEDKRIAHCDLKPENWLFESEDDNARLQLIDFGFSKHLQNKQHLTDRRGSTLYIAPEVFKGNYDGRADMWSIGVICFMMLFQEAPFISIVEGKVDPKETASLIKEGKYTFPEDEPSRKVSKEAREFIRRLLTVDPVERMTASEAQQHKWLKEAYDASLNATMSAFPQKLARRMRSFNELTSLQRTVNQVLAYMLDAAKITALRDEFAKLDETRNGEISFEEFQHAFERSNINMSETDLRQIFRSIGKFFLAPTLFH